MSVPRDLVTLSKDPIWPWSLDPFGLPLLALIALTIVVLTIWTYRGVGGASRGRVSTLIGLRLAALALACMVLLRPSLASHEDLNLPSTLLFLVDASESMTIQDEIGGQSRWEYLRYVLNKAEPALQKLRDEHNVSIVLYRFADDIADFDANGKADGKRTDFGQSLQSLYNLHGRDRTLRALLFFSDGADNGTRVPPLAEAAHWRSLPCPVHTFGLGKTTTADRQRDVAFTDINPVPSPVAIKGKLTVKATLDAPGFENAAVNVRLFIDGEEKLVQKETLRKTLQNEVSLVTDAPATRPKEGEIKVTLKVDPLPGEMTYNNNEISTYVTVTQEGIKVLLVDQPRFPEPQLICDALAPDPRINLYTAWLRTDEPSADDAKVFQFDKQQYDVIVLGDLSAKRLAAGHPEVLAKIKELVKDKGAGLLMMGGYNSFGNSDWRNTPVEELLPVELNVADQFDGAVRMEPTQPGLSRYVMRLADKRDDNQALWRKLPELNGMTRLGKEKAGALVLAVRGGTQEPLLVSQDYGKGRTMAFGGDTTWRWQMLGQPKSSEGIQAHARFWRHVVLWLAHQDETEGTVWIKPDKRRLDAGEKLAFAVGLRGKGGVEAPEAHFDVTVVDPKGNESLVPTAREPNGERGTFWKTDLPGEYRLVVRGRGKDADGQIIPEGQASARFLVYQSDTEMVRRAADHEFLAKLANSGGGKFHKAEDLLVFLKDLANQPSAQAKPKTDLWPDWRRSSLSGFRVSFLLLFTGLLCLEWFFRRYWGMV
jgi:uncharacterized membrane protein